jgi:two-component system, LytTR family, response regulator
MKAILIDDERNATEALTNMLRMVTPDVEVVGVANAAQQGIDLVQSLKPDLVFLDIQMPYMTGFELLEQLGQFNFSVVFTTAYDQYALQAFKVSAVDYLLKPIDMDELETAVEKVRERLKQPTNDFTALEKLFKQVKKNDVQRLTLPTSDGLVFIAIDDIIRLESDSNYTTFYLTKKERIVVSRTLGEYEPILTAQNFCRVHHSHIINMVHLKRYFKNDGGYAEMSDGSKVEISRRKKDDFMAKLDEAFK